MKEEEIANRAEVIQHLQMIQAVISRMNGNSFMIKRWSLVLFGASLLLMRSNVASNVADINLCALLLVLVPFFIGFWGLDAYYLWQENRFRTLYDGTRKKRETDFSMNLSSSGDRYCKTFCSITIFPLYAFEIALIALIVFKS